MDSDALQLPERELIVSARSYRDPRVNRERIVGKQVCAVAARFFPSFNEFTWGSLVGRITRAVMSARADEAYLVGLPPERLAPELSSIPTETLVQSASALRFRLRWMALRDVRFDTNLHPLGHVDGTFIDWLKLQPAETLQTWAAMFVTDWHVRGKPNEAAFRLARLKPTPLLLLWPYHCWHAAQLPAISDDRAFAEDAYIVGFVACHVRRIANDAARFPPYLETQTGYDIGITLPALQKKIHVANEFGTTISRAVYEEAEATASALLARWASTTPRLNRRHVIRVGTTCRVCASRTARPAEPGPPLVPPFQVGCTCELLFDSEYLGLLEADFVPDLLFWSSRASERSWRWVPLRRILLATAERQMLRAAADHLKLSACPEILALTPPEALASGATKVGGGNKRVRDGKQRAPQPRSGPKGSLLSCVIDVLKGNVSEWTPTKSIAASVQVQLQLTFPTELERRKWLKGGLGRALRELLKNGEVVRRETETWRYQTEWRLATVSERGELAPHRGTRPSLAALLVLPSHDLSGQERGTSRPRSSATVKNSS